MKKQFTQSTRGPQKHSWPLYIWFKFP